MKILMLFYITLLSFLGINVQAQKAKKTQKVQKVQLKQKKVDYVYVDVVGVYERVVEKGYKEEKMFKELGDCYYYRKDFVKAAKWYHELFAMNLQQDSEYYKRYSQALKAIGDCNIIDEMKQLSINKKS